MARYFLLLALTSEDAAPPALPTLLFVARVAMYAPTVTRAAAYEPTVTRVAELAPSS